MRIDAVFPCDGPTTAAPAVHPARAPVPLSLQPQQTLMPRLFLESFGVTPGTRLRYREATRLFASIERFQAMGDGPLASLSPAERNYAMGRAVQLLQETPPYHAHKYMHKLLGELDDQRFFGAAKSRTTLDFGNLSNRYFLARHGKSYGNGLGLIKASGGAFVGYALMPEGRDEVALSFEAMKQQGILDANTVIIASWLLRGPAIRRRSRRSHWECRSFTTTCACASATSVGSRG